MHLKEMGAGQMLARPWAFEEQLCRTGSLHLVGVAELGENHPEAEDSRFFCLVGREGVFSSGDHIPQPGI